LSARREDFPCFLIWRPAFPTLLLTMRRNQKLRFDNDASILRILSSQVRFSRNSHDASIESDCALPSDGRLLVSFLISGFNAREQSLTLYRRLADNRVRM